MTVVALTGGIASGKSTVANMFADLGAVCIDADIVSREVVASGTKALADIAQTFGPDIVRNGELDREALGRLVFADSQARVKLNAIVHPQVRARTAELIDQALNANPNAVVIYAIPLLVEASSGRTFDKVITVSASVESRIQRMISQRGMTEADAQARIASQADESERLAIADYVIDTNGTLDDTQRQVTEIWHELTSA
jgi:dephospho-CoA kinase